DRLVDATSTLNRLGVQPGPESNWLPRRMTFRCEKTGPCRGFVGCKPEEPTMLAAPTGPTSLSRTGTGSLLLSSGRSFELRRARGARRKFTYSHHAADAR